MKDQQELSKRGQEAQQQSQRSLAEVERAATEHRQRIEQLQREVNSLSKQYSNRKEEADKARSQLDEQQQKTDELAEAVEPAQVESSRAAAHQERETEVADMAQQDLDYHRQMVQRAQQDEESMAEEHAELRNGLDKELSEVSGSAANQAAKLEQQTKVLAQAEARARQAKLAVQAASKAHAVAAEAVNEKRKAASKAERNEYREERSKAQAETLSASKAEEVSFSLRAYNHAAKIHEALNATLHKHSQAHQQLADKHQVMATKLAKAKAHAANTQNEVEKQELELGRTTTIAQQASSALLAAELAKDNAEKTLRGSMMEQDLKTQELTAESHKLEQFRIKAAVIREQMSEARAQAEILVRRSEELARKSVQSSTSSST